MICEGPINSMCLCKAGAKVGCVGATLYAHVAKYHWL